MLDTLKIYHLLKGSEFSESQADSIVNAFKINNETIREPFEKMATKDDMHSLEQRFVLLEKMIYALGTVMMLGFTLIVYLIEK